MRSRRTLPSVTIEQNDKPRRGTAVAKDRVRPTPKQIQNGLIVVPSVFKDDHKNVNWRGFEVVFLGQPLGRKWLDQDNRLRLPLKTAIKDGDDLQLTLRDGKLHIDRAAS